MPRGRKSWERALRTLLAALLKRALLNGELTPAVRRAVETDPRLSRALTRTIESSTSGRPTLDDFVRELLREAPEYIEDIQSADLPQGIQSVDELARHIEKMEKIRRTGAELANTLFYYPNVALNRIRDVLTELSDVKDTGESGLDILRDGVKTGRIKTGYPPIDSSINGIQQGTKMILLTGDPSSGKTAFAIDWSLSTLKENKNGKVVFYSLEMTKSAIVSRMLLRFIPNMRNKIGSGQIGLGDIPPSKRPSVEDIFSRMIIKSRPMRVGEIYSDILTSAAMHKPTLFVVDYLQMVMARSSSNSDNLAPWIADVSRSLTLASKATGVPILAISQLRSDDGSKKSGDILDMVSRIMSRIWGGRTPAYLADMILHLERKKRTRTGVRETLYVIKDREGKISKVELIFKPSTMSFDVIGKPTDIDIHDVDSLISRVSFETVDY